MRVYILLLGLFLIIGKINGENNETCSNLEAETLLKGKQFILDKNKLASTRCDLKSKFQIHYNFTNGPDYANCTIIRIIPEKEWKCVFYYKNNTIWDHKKYDYYVRFIGLSETGDYTPLKGSIYVKLIEPLPFENFVLGILGLIMLTIFILIILTGDPFVFGYILGGILGASGSDSSSD